MLKTGAGLLKTNTELRVGKWFKSGKFVGCHLL